jgi:flagellar hook-length control protein FliK
LVVRLDPPELGAVVVRLTVQDGRVDVQVRTPDQGTSTSLSAQSREVQQVLADHGLSLSSFDVSQQPGSQGRRTPEQAPSAGTTHTDGIDTVTDDDNARPQPAGTWL